MKIKRITLSLIACLLAIHSTLSAQSPELLSRLHDAGDDFQLQAFARLGA